MRLKIPSNALPRQWLVIHDQHAQAHTASRAAHSSESMVRSGMEMRASTPPPSTFRSSNDCAPPYRCSTRARVFARPVPFASASSSVVSQSAVAVSNFEQQVLVLLPDAHGHHILALTPGNAVHDGVLHQGLKQQARNRGAQEPIVDIERKQQAIAKTPLVNPDVALEKLHLPAERHLGFVKCFDRQAEQFAQRQQDFLGAARIVINQRGGRLQCVEQEMRLQLAPQRLELNLRQPGFELRRP